MSINVVEWLHVSGDFNDVTDSLVIQLHLLYDITQQHSCGQ